EELVMLQRSVREFVEKRLVPLERDIEEKDEIPRSLIEAMAGMGLFGLGFSEEIGGQGFGKLGYCVAVEQLARANASLWNVIGGSAGLCGTAIDIGGPDALRSRYLPDLLSARKIGEDGKGFAIALATLDSGRMGLAAHAVGAAQRLLEACVAHAKTRTQFGRPIGTNQAIQWPLADAAIDIHAARLMVYDAASRADR